MWITILLLVVVVGGLALFRHYFTTAVQPKIEAERAAAEAEAEAARANEREQAHHDRLRYLRHKFGEADLVDRILAHEIWKGQTADELRESIGEPDSTMERVLKTTTKTTLKYKDCPWREYSDVTVTLEDGAVATWTIKSL